MIIGLCGIKGSGKSVVAKYIAENYGFKRINYKDELINHIKERFPNLLEEIQKVYPVGGVPRLGVQILPTIDELFEQKPPLMRALMVNVGTDDRRRDNDNHWVHAWAKTIATEAEQQDKDIRTINIVTDDVRFQNEFDAIKLLGGIIIRVRRSDITDGGSHPSETEQFNFKEDFTIEAEFGGHEAVYAQIRQIMDTINKD